MKWAWGLVFAALPALAGTLEEDFSTLTHRASSSTAVWNAGLGTAHVPFEANNAAAGLGTENTDIGDGTDGAFDESTYADFDTDNDVSSNTILVDTSRTYQFTTFHLAAGYTLRGNGTAPLIIRIQGAATVDGTIDISGGNGEDGNPDTGGAGDLTVVADGGTACCGGGVGGDGGVTGTPNGTAGSQGAAGSVGGGGGGSSAPPGSAGGGGGGASHGGLGEVGEDVGGGGGTGGTAGAQVGTEVSRLGGSGGGGGGLYALEGIVRDSTGGGGGGGGGSLQLYAGGAFTVSGSGSIDATGGDGGERQNNLRLNGSGGGGAGGSIYVFSGGTALIRAMVDARGGSGGPGSSSDVNGGGRPDGEGGDGGDGWPWIVVPTGTLVGVVVGGQVQPTPVNNAGTSRYQTGSFVLESAVIDSRIPIPVFTGLETDQTTPTNTSITLQIAGSNDRFVADDTGFLSPTEFTQLSGKRYVKFRATLSTTDSSVTPSLNAVRFLYDSSMYEFSLTSCARAVQPGTGGGLGGLIFWGMLLGIPWAFRLASWGWRQTSRQ